MSREAYYNSSFFKTRKEAEAYCTKKNKGAKLYVYRTYPNMDGSGWLIAKLPKL